MACSRLCPSFDTVRLLGRPCSLMWPRRFKADLHWDDDTREWRQLEIRDRYTPNGAYWLTYTDGVHLFKFVDLEYKQKFKDPRTVAEEIEGAAVLQQLIAQPRGFLQIIAFELEVSVLGSLPRKHA